MPVFRIEKKQNYSVISNSPMHDRLLSNKALGLLVRMNTDGEARFACLRGTLSQFRADVSGSDKRFGFFLPASDPQSAEIAVFESAIDALSHASLAKAEGRDWQDVTRLSLDGTMSIALKQYIKDHPHIKKINICLDNDDAGRSAAQKIKAQFSNQGCHIKISLPENAKDYNDLLRQSQKKSKGLDVKKPIQEAL